MAKSRDAFRTISEVADWLETPAHVLRFWESKFSQVKPVKRAGGRRYYRPSDMELLGGIKKLLHDDGMTIKGVQKILREQGVRHVASLSALSAEKEEHDSALIEDAPYTEVELLPEEHSVVAFTRDLPRPESVPPEPPTEDAQIDAAPETVETVSEPVADIAGTAHTAPPVQEPADAPEEEHVTEDVPVAQEASTGATVFDPETNAAPEAEPEPEPETKTAESPLPPEDQAQEAHMSRDPVQPRFSFAPLPDDTIEDAGPPQEAGPPEELAFMPEAADIRPAEDALPLDDALPAEETPPAEDTLPVEDPRPVEAAPDPEDALPTEYAAEITERAPQPEEVPLSDEAGTDPEDLRPPDDAPPAPVEAAASSLPGFLQRPMPSMADSAPSETPVRTAGALSHLSRIAALTPEQAARIAPHVAALRAAAERLSAPVQR